MRTVHGRRTGEDAWSQTAAGAAITLRDLGKRFAIFKTAPVSTRASRKNPQELYGATDLASEAERFRGLGFQVMELRVPLEG